MPKTLPLSKSHPPCTVTISFISPANVNTSSKCSRDKSPIERTDVPVQFLGEALVIVVCMEISGEVDLDLLESLEEVEEEEEEEEEEEVPNLRFLIAFVRNDMIFKVVDQAGYLNT